MSPTAQQGEQSSRGPTVEERLERGEVVYYPVCPFALPEGDDRQFLLEQQLRKRVHKNISYNPHTGKAGGFLPRSPRQAERLRQMLESFSATATEWLGKALPRYPKGWALDRVSYRPEEESTRQLGQRSRNDLLHVDAFPSRPTNGHRILRLFANVNLTEPRVWITSEPFGKLLARYGKEVGLPGRQKAPWGAWLKAGMLRVFRPGQPPRSAYDAFMLRMHDFLKANEDFQKHVPKQVWKFAPGSAWMAITDTASHAALSGRFALEHSYFIAPHALALPGESPAALLEQACGQPVLRRVA